MTKLKTDMAKRKTAKAKRIANRDARPVPVANDWNDTLKLVKAPFASITRAIDIFATLQGKAVDAGKRVDGALPKVALTLGIKLGVECLRSKGTPHNELENALTSLATAAGWSSGTKAQMRLKVHAFICQWYGRHKKAELNRVIKTIKADGNTKRITSITKTWPTFDSNAAQKKKGKVSAANKAHRVTKKDWCDRPHKVVVSKLVPEAMAFYMLVGRAHNHKAACSIYTKAYETIKRLADEHASLARIQIDWAKNESAVTK